MAYQDTRRGGYVGARRGWERWLLRIVALGVAAWAAGAIASARTEKAAQLPSQVIVTVQPGDTLWEIARRHTPPRRDVRSTIYRLKKMNGITGSLIHPGQVVRVPL